MAHRYVRHRPGSAWLVAFVAIPLLLAVIGWVHTRPPAVDADAGAPSVHPSATLTAPPSTAAPEMNFAPLSIAQTGDGFTLGGELPSLEAKTSLSQSLKLAFGSGVKVIDNITVKPGGNAPDFAALGSILGSAVDITGFRFELNADTVTLSGQAPNQDAKTEVQSAVTAAWPKMRVVNNIRVG